MVTLFCCAWLAPGLVLAQTYPPVPSSCGILGESGKGGDFCNYTSTKVFWDGTLPKLVTDQPKFIKSVPNGHRYEGAAGTNDSFFIAHVYSPTDSAYDMGKALGDMFAEEYSTMFEKF